MSTNVKVSAADTQSARLLEHNHPTGEAITVEDGHLVVQGAMPTNKATRTTVAIYAPGRWHRAEVQGDAS